MTLYFDPARPNIDYGRFTTKRDEFQEQYRGAEEEMHHNMPISRGRPVITTAFVDTSHAANKKNRRSHTRYAIFID